MKRFRLQYRTGPLPDDRTYATLAAAKGLLSRYARRLRSFGWVVVDQATGDCYQYDSEKRAVVKLPPKPTLTGVLETPAVQEVLAAKKAERPGEPPQGTYVNISPHDVHGKTLTKVYIIDAGWKAYKSKTKVPDSSRLLNFDLTFGGRTLLVLDNYGAEHLPEEMAKRLLENCTTDNNPETGITLGIDRKTGEFFAVAFAIKARKTITLVFQLRCLECLKVPAEFLPRLDELKSSKRPFWVTVQTGALFGFITREVGYKSLEEESMIVGLDFRPMNLEVSNDCYRLVGRWS